MNATQKSTEDKKKKIIDELPKPQTAEDQYMYSFACTLAGISYNTPFQSPFYRKDKYWKAILDIEGLRILDKITGDMIDSGTIKSENISNGAISKEKIDESLNDAIYGDERVDTSAIRNKAVTIEKISDDVANRLLAKSNVTEDNLAEKVKNKLLGSKNVTKFNLSDDLSSKLLADGYSGIVKQTTVGPLGSDATNAGIIAKINELLQTLEAAEVIG